MAMDADRSIGGVAKTISEVLSKKKYAIDYYQREYKWERKQLEELVSDLTSRFLQLFEPEHHRRDVARYPGYFLGSIIVSQKGEQPFVVDGQQRLTSLTLFLTYLNRLQEGRGGAVSIDDLIYSESYGEKSFNLDVPDRNDCMRALFDEGEYDPPEDAAESVATLVARFGELDALFPDELKGDALPYFIDWLKDRVQLVQITAYNDDDAYAIFETMNDRGLKLTPADMLKGYLLANIREGEHRTQAATIWRSRLQALDEYYDEASTEFLKAWLRSQYSTKIRERRKGAVPEDWDKIGTEFHRWLRSAHQRIGLTSREAFYRFVTKDLDFYGRQFERILRVSEGSVPAESPLRFVHFNEVQGFTLQDQLLLAPLNIDDSPEVIEKKFEIVGRYIDILLAWRVWNSRSTAYSTMSYAMFIAMRDIRGLGVTELAQTLYSSLSQIGETFDGAEVPSIHQQNRRQLHILLARLTDYVTIASGGDSNFYELVGGGSVNYEVEHIWANHPERHMDDFDHPSDFSRYRNRIGGLLLVPKQFNASYGDDPFKKKREHYLKQNLLAQSLHPLGYQNSPGFLAFSKATGLPFRAYSEFSSSSIDERGELYRALAKVVWNPEDLLAVAE